VAQTKKKKRRRKHAGTQAGTVTRQAQAAKPQSKEARREEARRKRLERLDRPPTIRGSISRAAIAAVIFVGVVIVALGRTPLQGVALGAFMFVLYIPIGYYTDLFIYRRRQRKKGQAGGDDRPARKPKPER
jgi:Flp pilus assembly protein TadB